MPPHASPCPAESSLQLDLHRARTALIEAELACHPGDRFLAAHLAALRVAAVVLSVRARPGQGSSRPRNAWLVLAEVAPELGEWAAFFAASEGKRDAVRAGATAIINAREADDLVRDAQAFLRLVEQALGRSGRLHQTNTARENAEARRA
ncbi:MAG: SAV_6107 family HEPN domain-containing protein [Propionibacteriaceae bacterium]